MLHATNGLCILLHRNSHFVWCNQYTRSWGRLSNVTKVILTCECDNLSPTALCFVSFVLSAISICYTGGTPGQREGPTHAQGLPAAPRAGAEAGIRACQVISGSWISIKVEWFGRILLLGAFIELTAGIETWPLLQNCRIAFPLLWTKLQFWQWLYLNSTWLCAVLWTLATKEICKSYRAIRHHGWIMHVVLILVLVDTWSCSSNIVLFEHFSGVQ